MSELALGGLLIGALVFLVLIGLHIAVALTAVGFAGIWLIREDVDMAMRLMYLSAYNGVADYIFATIPLFVLMGLLVSISNVGKDTFDVAETLLRRLRGGLGVATVAANTVFATAPASNPLADLLIVKKDTGVSSDTRTTHDQAIAPDGSAQVLTAHPEIRTATPADVKNTLPERQAERHATALTEAVNAKRLASDNLTANEAKHLADAAPSAILAHAPTGTVPSATVSGVTVSSATIAAPLNSNAWTAEFSQKVSWVSTQQNQIAELHLNPPDLGPMHVVLTMTDNQASAQFSSPHSMVREAIENALPQLRQNLADNGIMLGNATVSDQAPRDNNGSGSFLHQRNRPETVNSVTAESAVASRPISPPRHIGLVDTFA